MGNTGVQCSVRLLPSLYTLEVVTAFYTGNSGTLRSWSHYNSGRCIEPEVIIHPSSIAAVCPAIALPQRSLGTGEWGADQSRSGESKAKTYQPGEPPTVRPVTLPVFT